MSQTRTPDDLSSADVVDETADEVVDETAVRTKSAETSVTTEKAEKRTTARVFVKEVRGELRKVAWPTRKETLNYSGVVAIALVFMTILIFCLDWVFSEFVLRLFNVK